MIDRGNGRGMHAYAYYTSMFFFSSFFCTSLKIPIYFEAVIASVGDDQVSIRSQGQSLRPVEWIRLGIDEGEKAAFLVKDLNPGVAPIGDEDDVGFRFHGDARGRVELAIAFAAGAESEEKGAAGGVEDLDAVIVIIRDVDLVRGGIDGHELRGGELVFAGSAFAKSRE